MIISARFLDFQKFLSLDGSFLWISLIDHVFPNIFVDLKLLSNEGE
jgi:hypothetical protein